MANAAGVIPFVGREEAFEALLGAAEAARSGSGGLVLLTGDPGIGKTRVLEELRRRARADGMRALVGHCLEGGGAAPFWPWAQVLRAWSEDGDALGRLEELGAPLSILAGALPELRDRFPNLPPPPPLEGEVARFRMLDAATAILRRSARKLPLLVMLEDIHWADEGSLRLLSFAARDLRDAPILLVASVRDIEIDEAHPLSAPLSDLSRVATTLVLRGLDFQAVAELLRASSGTRPSDELTRRVSERTGGNPLFVLETARSLHDVQATAEASEIPLPQGIRHALQPRIARRSEPCRRVIEAGAVIGDEFRVDQLQRVVAPLEPDAMLSALAEAVESGLVVRSAGSELHYRFVHALVRELLYDELGPARQIALHARVVEAVLADPAASDAHLAQLAYHACRAAPGGGAEAAIGHARRAAEDALARFAPEDAVHYYERALDVLHLMAEPRPELHCDLLIALGQAQTRSGKSAEAVVSLERAAELARSFGSPERLARIALAYPAAHTSTTMSASIGGERANALLIEALEALPAADGAERCRLLARLARGDAAGGERAAEAVAMARRLGDATSLALALDAQHYALWEPEHLHRRVEIAAELERLGRESGNLFTCFRAGHAALGDQLELGDRRALGATLDRLDHRIQQLRQPALGLVPFHTRACETFLDGDLAGYEEKIREALPLAQRAGGSDALAVFGGQLSMLRREQGRLDELLPNFESLVARYPDIVAYRIHLAWIHGEAGRVDDARTQLAPIDEDGVEAIPRDGFLLLNLHFAGETAAAIGDRGLALALYERLLPYAGRAVVLGAVLCFGAADRTLGRLAALLGRSDAASEHFDRALQLDAGMEAVPCLAHSRIEMARFLLTRNESGDGPRVRTLLQEALSAARKHHLTLCEQRANELSSGARTEPAPPAPLNSPSATPPPDEPNLFHREGDTWLLRYDGVEKRLKGSKGLECLATLVAAPGREFPALELAGPPGTGGMRAGEDEVLDPPALAAYRERLESLREELADAERFHDAGRRTRLQEEIEQISDQLASGVGLGGRARRTAGSAERARKAVYNRVRNAIGRIRSAHPPLARHLEASVRTGHVCCYQPERPTAWRVD